MVHIWGVLFSYILIYLRNTNTVISNLIYICDYSVSHNDLDPSFLCEHCETYVTDVMQCNEIQIHI